MSWDGPRTRKTHGSKKHKKVKKKDKKDKKRSKNAKKDKKGKSSKKKKGHLTAKCPVTHLYGSCTFVTVAMVGCQMIMFGYLEGW